MIRWRKLVRVGFLSSALTLFVSSCADDPIGASVENPAAIDLSTATVTLQSLGDTVRVTARVKDRKGNDLTATVQWASDNADVATVTAGTIKAVGNGTAMVTATAGSISSVITVTVQQAATIVSVTPGAVTLETLGANQQLSATAADARGNPVAGSSATWSSSDSTVARVSSAGLVTAVKDGTATISASLGGRSGSTQVIVRQRAVELRVNPPSSVVGLGSTVALTATLVDGGGSPLANLPSTIVWSSENPAVASVSNSGMVTTIIAGSARIIATMQSFSAASQIRVEDDRGDLGVGWIHRQPVMDYVANSTNPTRDGWPSVGQVVTWQSVVKNWSAYERKGVRYRWLVDGAVVAQGMTDLPARAHTSVALSRPWSFTRARLRFEIDHSDDFVEAEERNNSLEVFTDALSIGFYVERSLYDYFAQHQSKLGIGSNSWEDWAQRQLRLWNQMLETARYPLTPNGVLDRVRLDKITIVNDGALPLAGGLPTNTPNLGDRTVDLQWGFPSSLISMYANQTSAALTNPFFYEGSLPHELGHARYLIDVYGFNVLDGGWTPAGIIDRGSNIAIRENGQLVSGSVYMPIAAWEVLFYTPMTGMMNGQYTLIDEYSAAAMNLIAGRRAVSGNTNAPANIGIFMNDLPTQNRLAVKDSTGTPLAGASVRVYQAAPKSGQWYGKFYDDTPDLVLTADSQGRVLLGRNPFGGTRIVHTHGHANGVIIIRVEHNGRVGYGFLESWRFNMEYWSGRTAQGEYEVTVKLR